MRITIRDARELCGCSVSRASMLTNLSIEKIERYEEDFDDVPLCDRVVLLRLYNASTDLIYPGTRGDCIQANMMKMTTSQF